jgi:hypothetical protein
MRQADVGFDPKTADVMITPGLRLAMTRVIAGLKGLANEDPFAGGPDKATSTLKDALTGVRDRFDEDGRLVPAKKPAEKAKAADAKV